MNRDYGNVGSMYSVFHLKAPITKRHISGSRADKMILKNVLESSVYAIFYVKILKAYGL